MAKQMFGTDGVRGIPGTYPLDDATLFWIGRSLGAYLRRREQSPRVLLGMDTPDPGPPTAAWTAAGLAAEGPTASPAGLISTPGVACLVRKESFSAGVVISASHNLYQDNGVKLFSGSGMKFADE